MANQDTVPDPKDSPPARKSRGWRALRWLGAFCILGVAGLSAAIYWRIPLANTLIGFGLDRAGLSDAAVRVSALTTTHLRIAEIRLGDAVYATNIDVDLDIARLPGNPVTHIAVESLRATPADLQREISGLSGAPPTDSAPPSIRALLKQVADLPDASIRKLDLRHVENGRKITIAGSAETKRTNNGEYSARFRIIATGTLGGQTHVLGIDGNARIATDRATAKIAARMEDGALTGNAALDVKVSADTATIDGSLRIEASDLGELGVFIAALNEAGGRVAVTARTTSPLTFGLDTPLGGAALAAALQKAGNDGFRIDAEVEGGGYGKRLIGVDGTVSAVLRRATGAGDRLEADGKMALRARRAADGGISAADMSMDGAYRLRRNADALTLAFPGGVRASARLSGQTGGVAVRPVKVALNADRLRINASGDGRFRNADVRLDLTTTPARISLRPAPDPRNLSLAPLSLRVQGIVSGDGRADATIRSPRVSIAETNRAALVENMNLSIERSPSGISARLRGRASARQDGKPVLNPTPTDTSLSLKEAKIAFNAKAMLPGATALTVRGRHNLPTGRGNARLSLPGFRLTPGGDELRSLIPSLSGAAAGIEFRSGTVRTETDLSWDREGFRGSGSVGIADIGFTDPASGATVEGLTANIGLERLVPPRTPPGQTIRIGRIEAGVALTDTRLRFALIEGIAPALPAIRIEAFRTGFAGGGLSLTPTVIDPNADRIQASLNVERVDLAALLDAVGLENISGTGRLNGVIPVRTEGDAVGITGGRLAAAGPGALRIRSEAAKRVLAQGGEEVVLMLSALEDFRYETLTMEIEKEIAGEGRVVLRTRGQNPAVRDGQPFVINLNLTGNVDNLAAVLAQALKLPGGIVRSMLNR